MGEKVLEYQPDPGLCARKVWERQKEQDRLAKVDRQKRFAERGGVVLEFKEATGDNGDAPRFIPQHWVCGREDGELVDPPEITGSHQAIHFIASIDDIVSKDKGIEEWQGALPGHPVLADKKDWATPAWINFREEAIQEAKKAHEIKIHQSDALPADRAAVQQS